jgi:hypothetical protein
MGMTIPVSWHMAFLGFILLVVALNGAVSFGIASFIRSTVLAVIASTAITEMLGPVNTNA